MRYLFLVLALLGAYFGLRYFIRLVKEVDTTMQLKLVLIEANRFYEYRYGFKPRTTEISLENNMGQLGFTQFRGRL